MEYDEKLRQESKYWGENAKALFATGAVPYDFDSRRATRVSDPKIFTVFSSRRSDPLVEAIWENEKIAKIRALLHSCKDAIDLGCGGGWMTLELARSGVDVTGFDIGEERLQIARDYYEMLRSEEEGLGKVVYKRADLNKIELPPESTDFAISVGTFHHVLENAHLVQEVYKALRPGGYFVIMDVAEERFLFANRVGQFVLLLMLLLVPSFTPFVSRLAHLFFSFVGIFLGHDRTHHLKIFLKKILFKNKDIAAGAPFEGVGTHTVDVVRSAFSKVEVSYSGSFRIKGLLNLKLRNRKPVLEMLNRIDNLFSNTSWCPGTVLLLVARKE